MKFAKRIVLGLLGTAALTSFILSSLDTYVTDPAASATVQTNLYTADKAARSEKTDLHAKDEQLSIGTSERHILYQPQGAAPSHTGDSADAAQSYTEDSADATQSEPDPSDASQSEQSKTASLHTVQSKQSEKNSLNTTKSKQENASMLNDRHTQTANAADSKKAADKKSGSQADTKNKPAVDKDRNVFQTVTKDYFSDALFIGDSRTVGMLQSHLLPEASYYAKTGIGIGEILSKHIVNEGGRMISIKNALSQHSFGKVYIMIGINDISAGDSDWFTEHYKDILKTIRQTQPDALIYIQGNIPMSYGTQDPNGALNNKNLSIRNEASRALADNEHIFYLDTDKIYADADGNLQSSYTTDGLHVSNSYYPLWVDYLLQHAVVR